jgi:repressor LexA
MKQLTKRQAEILDYIRSFHRSHGYAPTYRELKTAFNLSSLASIFKHIEGLQAKGYIKKSKRVSRSLEPVEDDLPGKEVLAKSIPLIGSISKGKKLELFAQIKTVELPHSFIKNAGVSKGEALLYGFLVKDESFLDESILQGDLIIIEAKDKAKSTDMVLAGNEQDEIFICAFTEKKVAKIHGVILTLIRNYDS